MTARFVELVRVRLDTRMVEEATEAEQLRSFNANLKGAERLKAAALAGETSSEPHTQLLLELTRAHARLSKEPREAMKDMLGAFGAFIEWLDPHNVLTLDGLPLKLAGALADLDRGVAVEWLKPGRRKGGPEPLGREEWVRRASLAATLRRLRREAGEKLPEAAARIARAVAEAKGPRLEPEQIINWRKDLESGRAPAEALQAYQAACKNLEQIPLEDILVHAAAIALAPDLTDTPAYRMTLGKPDPRKAGR